MKKRIGWKAKSIRITILFFISFLEYSEYCHFYNEEIIIKVVVFGPVVALIIWDLACRFWMVFFEKIREHLGRNFGKKLAEMHLKNKFSLKNSKI